MMKNDQSAVLMRTIFFEELSTPRYLYHVGRLLYVPSVHMVSFIIFVDKKQPKNRMGFSLVSHSIAFIYYYTFSLFFCVPRCWCFSMIWICHFGFANRSQIEMWQLKKYRFQWKPQYLKSFEIWNPLTQVWKELKTINRLWIFHQWTLGIINWTKNRTKASCSTFQPSNRKK